MSYMLVNNMTYLVGEYEGLKKINSIASQDGSISIELWLNVKYHKNLYIPGRRVRWTCRRIRWTANKINSK